MPKVCLEDRRRPALRLTGILRFAAILLLAASVGAGETASANDGPALEFFESKVRPLLIDRCYECHSNESGEASGDLLLDSASAMLTGGSQGPVLVPGDPDASLIMKAVLYKDADMQMPPDGKLDADAIEVLRTWIRSGAADPRQAVVDAGRDVSPLTRDPQSHWAFVPPRAVDAAAAQAIDAAAFDGQQRDLLDAIAADRAEKVGVPGAPTADRSTLIRRLYFDLIGTPPSFDQVQAFTTSTRPDAYPRLVDELLSRPEFGERFGRHWLDVARYADTIGYGTAGKDRRIHGSERFRDWVIRVFNTDMPYDEMLMHQLAGDRTDPTNERGDLDAMGFLTVGRRYLNRHDILDDRIDVVTRGLLGLTVTCARCHDHKFDPIPTVDYYSLYGVFASSTVPAENRRGKDDADENDDDSAIPSPLAMFDLPNPRDSHVFVRGQPGNRGEVAPRRYLTSLRGAEEAAFDDGSGRFQLAERIADSENPLTARVMVNRVWMHLIGRPLVDSPSDFGFRTAAPAVPEVLDDLAFDFATDFSIKRLIRRIVMTRMYRQSSRVGEVAAAVDPENRLMTRANRRRRDFESLRDSMLQVAGQLDSRIGGTPVDITLSSLAERRTVYAMIDRQNLPSLFRTFDFASPDAHAPRRYYTTVPQQALYLLNHGHAGILAKSLADQVRVVVDPDDRASVQQAVDELFRRVHGRTPGDAQRRMMSEFLSTPVTPVDPVPDPRSLWTYGTGRLSEQNVVDFTPLPVFQDNRWTADREYPSPGPLGYASLGVEMGHPGPDDDAPGQAGAVIRRWTVPRGGEVRISGMIGHRTREGDGIKATILAGDRRLFSGQQKSNNRPFKGLTARVRAGDTVDFIASAGETTSHDSFFWRINLSLQTDQGDVIEADSRADFSGPFDASEPLTLDRLEQLAQVLLISNEFAFVQ